MADSFEELLLGCLGALPPPEREPVKTVYERMADQQRELLAGLEVSSQPATLDYDNIWVEAPWDALDEPRVVLAAYAPEQPRDRPVNLWHLTPQARPQSTPDDHYLDLNTLWIKRPSLVKVLALPAGFRAYLDGETIEAIFDAAGQQVLGTGGPQSV
ncbi:MAG TPA: hypothetical protein VK689_04610, partial [Armatimonadota bacterium]|nr:hypothetical protein [Armatimonadota bacterium]